MSQELKVTFSDKNNKFQYDGHAVRFKIKSMKKKSGKLYLGDRDSCSMVQLKWRNITNVVCADTDLHGCCKEETVKYLKIDPIDSKRTCLDQAYKFIDSALESGQNTLITCHSGLGKSATVLLYYIMKREGMTLADAHRYVEESRPGVHSDSKTSGFRPACVELLMNEEKGMYKGQAASCALRDRKLVYIDGKASKETNSSGGRGTEAFSRGKDKNGKDKKPLTSFQVFRAVAFMVVMFAFMFFFIGAARKFLGLKNKI